MGEQTYITHQRIIDIEKNQNTTDRNLWSVYGNPISTDFAFGVLLVIDFSNKKKYLLANIPSLEGGTHAEDVMYETLKFEYGAHGLPAAAKIIFYCTKSPCTQCSSKMVDEYSQLCSVIEKGNRKCILSFVFREWYVFDPLRGNERPLHMWGSRTDAWNAYQIIRKRTNGGVNIRPYENTQIWNRQHLSLREPVW